MNDLLLKFFTHKNVAIDYSSGTCTTVRAYISFEQHRKLVVCDEDAAMLNAAKKYFV